jgi:N-acetylmuramoyl-L-alanine amidase
MATGKSYWDDPYPGGQMVAVKGFPRPMYPPRAKEDGHTPSKNGPDVVAYKRTVSRAGRWPWQAFDEEYSNPFAFGEGDGWDPATSGVRGVQRQSQQISPQSGYIGKATFNLLRSIRIPEGLPNAGEPAMDATAVNLINEAWGIFGGSEGGAPAGKLTRKAIPSPNYSSRGGASVRLIVIHTAEGATTIESLGNFFASSSAGVSSHTGADDKKGVIGEYVKRGNKAWTASNANPVAVQIELCAFASWSRDTWMQHPNMLENCTRWIAEEAAAFGIPITKLSASQAQGSGRGVCQHNDLGSWGGGHWDCGSGFPIDHVLDLAR